jgi:hypothetical protein
VTIPSGLTVLLERPLPGETALALLERRAIAPHEAVRRLADWLERWHQLTAVEGVLDEARLDAEVLRPAEAIAPWLAGGAEYRAWLQGRCRALAGARVRLVACHADLTMSNVLLEPGAAPGIVDWETARASALPLRDLWYAAADAEAAAGRYHDRPAAYERSRRLSSPTGRVVAEASERIREALDLSPAVVTLCLHACWLQHAAEEQAKRGPGEARPFLAILAQMAAERAA